MIAVAGLASASVAQEGAESGETVRIDNFSEPVELNVLVSYIAGDLLGWNYQTQTPLNGTITFNAAQEIPLDKLPRVLEAFLDQYDYALTFNEDTGFYVIRAAGDVDQNFVGDLATTKLVSTPNIRPSALQAALDSVLDGGGKIDYLDELGAVLISAPARRIAKVETLIEQIIAERGQLTFYRIELTHLAPQAALDQALALVGSGGGQSRTGANQANRRAGTDPNVQAALGGASGQSLDNLADRLLIAPSGNALIYHGRESELPRVREIIELVDQQSSLSNKKYFAGGSAAQIAQLAAGRGLGEVINLANAASQSNAITRVGDPAGINPFAQQQQGTAGGSKIIVDAERGTITYYGTTEQQQQMQQLIDELDPEEDRIVIENYPLRHADAEDVADVINQLLGSGSQGATTTLLPIQGQNQQQNIAFELPGGEDGELSLAGAENVNVVADTNNNQIMIQAPRKMQKDFGKLLEKLDLRKPQVYIEATIVTVSDQETFELAFETQLINAGGTGGALQTNFGLTPLTDGGDFLTAAALNPGLGGLTGGIVLSEYLPIALNAAASETDTRIVSSPQLLVDDNEEATIVSLSQQPTTTTTQAGTGSEQTSFGGFEDAGTTLTVTPRISDGGYMSLEYAIELSNFVGAGTDGVPAPREERSISGSVTVPGDATIVIGGIKTSQTSSTINKIPWLSDIPGIGELFKSRNETASDGVLYVFITPKIMRDPSFRDLLLLTEGPQHDVEITDPVPTIEAAMMPVNLPLWAREPSTGLGTQPAASPAPVIELPDNEPEAGEADPGEDDPGRVRRRRDG